MNKQLTPLEALKKIGKLKVEGFRIIPTTTIVSDYIYYNIIEKALKRLEELEIENSKQFKEKWVQDNLAMTFELNVANKKLKALEIIKNKRVNADDLIESDDLEEYNRHMSYCYGSFLTQEEFELLKEVLL